MHLQDKVPSACVLMTACAWLIWHLIAKVTPALSSALQKIRWSGEMKVTGGQQISLTLKALVDVSRDGRVRGNCSTTTLSHIPPRTYQLE